MINNYSFLWQLCGTDVAVQRLHKDVAVQLLHKDVAVQRLHKDVAVQLLHKDVAVQRLYTNICCNNPFLYSCDSSICVFTKSIFSSIADKNVAILVCSFSDGRFIYKFEYIEIQ